METLKLQVLNNSHLEKLTLG